MTYQVDLAIYLPTAPDVETRPCVDSTSDEAEQHGYEFAEFLHNHAKGCFWDGMFRFFRELGYSQWSGDYD